MHGGDNDGVLHDEAAAMGSLPQSAGPGAAAADVEAAGEAEEEEGEGFSEMGRTLSRSHSSQTTAVRKDFEAFQAEVKEAEAARSILMAELRSGLMASHKLRPAGPASVTSLAYILPVENPCCSRELICEL